MQDYQHRPFYEFALQNRLLTLVGDFSPGNPDESARNFF